MILSEPWILSPGPQLVNFYIGLRELCIPSSLSPVWYFTEHKLHSVCNQSSTNRQCVLIFCLGFVIFGVSSSTGAWLTWVAPLNETDASPPSRHRLPIVPQIGLVFLTHFQMSILGFLSGLSSRGTCACCHHCCEFIGVTAQLSGKLLFPCGRPPPLVLTTFLPPFCNDPWTLGGRSLIQRSYSGVSSLLSLILYTLSCCGFLC